MFDGALPWKHLLSVAEVMHEHLTLSGIAKYKGIASVHSAEAMRVFIKHLEDSKWPALNNLGEVKHLFNDGVVILFDFSGNRRRTGTEINSFSGLATVGSLFQDLQDYLKW